MNADNYGDDGETNFVDEQSDTTVNSTKSFVELSESLAKIGDSCETPDKYSTRKENSRMSLSLSGQLPHSYSPTLSPKPKKITPISNRTTINRKSVTVSPTRQPHTEPTPIAKPPLVQPQYEAEPIRNDNNLFWIVFSIITAIVILIFACYVGTINIRLFTTSENSDTATHKPVVCTDFISLGQQYPNQSDKFWAFFKSGVERVANRKPTKPSIFMLLHETNTNIKQLVAEVAEATQKCLGTMGRSPIYLTATNLKTSQYQNDYGAVISNYKSALSDSGIMIVENFDEVPAYVAQAFHTICDGESPYVPRSVIILTMPINKLNVDSNPYTVAEKHLTALWRSTLPDNVLEPLVHRVTDVTVHVN